MPSIPAVQQQGRYNYVISKQSYKLEKSQDQAVSHKSSIVSALARKSPRS